MRAALDDVPLFEHGDMVGIGDGRQAVTHDDHRTSAPRFAQVLENLRLGMGVDRRQRIVEQQQRRIREQRPGDRDPLALAARQGDAFSPTGVS